MNRTRSRRLHLLAALLLAALFLAALPATASAAPFTGTVRDAAGRPLAGARVELFAPVAPWREMAAALAGEPLAPHDAARTDAGGRYELAAPAGLWVIEVTAAGLEPHRRPVPLDGEAYEHEEIVLGEGGEIAVTVRDATGRPLPGARVAAVAGGRAVGGVGSRPRRGVTDEGGRVELPRPSGAAAELAAVAPGMAPARFLLAAGDAAAALRLDPGVPWTIEVLDRRRRPVAGAVVATDAALLPLAVSGTDGRAEVRLPAGEEVALAVRAAAGHGRLVAAPPPKTGEDGEAPRTAVVMLEPPGRLAGRVLEASQRRPLAGALVWHAVRPDLQATSGADGGFVLPHEPDAAIGSRWMVRAAAAGHGGHGQWVSHGAEETVFLLSPQATISGRVVDEAGAPVAGASLVASSQGAWRPGRLPAGDRARSGDDGRFRLVRLEPERMHHLVVEHPRFAATEMEVTAPVAGAARPGVEVVLVRGNAANGLVFAADGRPLAGAEVRLSRVRQGGFRFVPRMGRPGDEPDEPHTATDAEGRFRLANVLPGPYDLHVAAAGHAPLRVPGVEVPEAPTDGDLGSVYLEPGADVAGRVVDAAGEPLAGVEVHVYARDLLTGMTGASADERVATGADGRFTLPDLTPGAVVDLMFQAAGFAQETVMGVTAPTERPLLVELAASAVVAGRVVDALGAGIAGATVQAETDEAGLPGRRRYDSRPAYAQSGEDGGFVVEGVPPGAVRLAANAGGFRPGRSTALELAPGERREGLRIELERGGSLAGRVTGPDGQPLAEAMVNAASNLVWHDLGERTDGDGNYRIDGLPEGVLQVRAMHPDFLPAVREVTVGSGDLRLDLRLEAGHRVSGRVIDEAGAPLAGAWVRIGGSPMGGMIRPVSSRADGSFEIDGVAPGTWRVGASKEGYVVAGEEPEVEVGGPVSGVEVRMAPGAAIVGRVRGVEAAEIARLHVAASPGDGGGMTFSGAVDYEGGFRIEGLAPGRWRVMALLGEGGGWRAARWCWRPVSARRGSTSSSPATWRCPAASRWAENRWPAARCR